MIAFWQTLLDALIDTLLDTLKVAPFLFLIYLFMEFIEHKAGDKTKDFISKSGKFGPLLGGLLGAVPQCGFSAACSGLYAGGVITMGTLLAVFLSTSDEMLPILLTGGFPVLSILKIIGVKVLFGALIGFIVDIIVRTKSDSEHKSIHDMCEHDHCHCEKGIFRSALHHFLEIILYLFIFTLAINIAVGFVGEDNLAKIFVSVPVVGNMISALIGLIPNCAASIVITDLYLSGVISSGVMMSGLLVGAGVGLAVLFKSNRNLKQNVLITVILYVVGVLLGTLIDVFGIVF